MRIRGSVMSSVLKHDAPALRPAAAPWRPSTSAGQPDVDLALGVRPLIRRAQPADELVERAGIGGRELEPREEVEVLAEIPAVMQAPGHRRQILETRRDVVRPGLEDPPPPVLA